MGTSTTDTKLRSVFLVVTVLLPVLTGAAVLPGSVAAGNSSIDAAGNQYDATLDSGDTYWQGQRVALQAHDPDSDAGSTYGVSDSDGSVRAIGLDGNAEYILDTSDLNGSYVVENENGTALNFTDGIASSNLATPSQTELASFTVERQTLDVTAADDEYAYGEYAQFNVSSNRGDFVVNVSAAGLNASQLETVFGRTDTDGDLLNTGPFGAIRGAGGERVKGNDSVVVYPDADVVAVYVERGGQIRANVTATALPTGNHTFAFDVQAATANASETLEVRAADSSGDGGGQAGIGDRSALAVDDVSLATNGTEYGYRNLDSIPSDGTLAVVVGANNDSYGASVPVANATVDVTVQRPDGTEDTVTVTTNETGSAMFHYDLAGKANGTYTVEAASYPSQTHEFRVGTVTQLVPDGDYLVTGEETNVTLHAAVDGQGVDVQRTVVVERWDNGWTTVESYDVRTGDDGFATVGVTPPENGRYRINTVRGDTVYSGIYATAGRTRARLLLHDRYRTDVAPGGRVSIAGTVMDGESPLANGDLTLTVYNRTGREVAENISVTTNANGQFATTWKVPDVAEGTDYRVRLSGETVGTVATEFHEITVEDDVPTSDSGGGDGSDGGSTPQPYLDIVQSTYDEKAPGQTVSYTVDVTAADGTAVADQEVFYSLQLGSGGVSVATGTVRTNADGRANITTTVPEWAPYGTELYVTGVTTVDGTTVADEEWDEELVRYKLDGTFYDSEGTRWGDLQPGERFTYNLTVRDTATDEPVTGLPIGLAIEAHGLGVGMDTVNATRVRTDATGTATFRGRVPNTVVENVQVDTIAVPRARGDLNFVNYETVSNYSTRINGHDFYREVQAGETVTFNVTTHGTTLPSTAVVVVGTNDEYDTNETILGNDTALFSGVVQTGETVSFQVPTNVEDGQTYRVRIMTSTPNGPMSDRFNGVIDRRFTVNSSQVSDEAPPAASAALPDRISVNNTFVVDASGSDDDTGIETYSVTTETGATVNGTDSVLTVPGFDSTGTYNVTVTVTDAFGKSDSVTKQVEVVRAADVVGTVSVADEQRYRDNQTATVDISNDGSRVVDGAVAVNVTTTRDGVPAFTETFDVNGLGVGESVTRTVEFTSWVRTNNVTGDVTVSLGAVSPDNVTEATLRNNNDTATTTVTYADLNTSVYVSGGAYENSNATVYAFVRNRGTTASAPVNGTFAFGNETVDLSVPALEPGEVHRTSLERTLTGDTNVSLAVSGEEELFPAGNRTERTITVEPFDVTMNYVSGERRVEAGSEFYLSTSFETTSESDVTLDIDLPDGLSLVRGSTTRTAHAYEGTNWESWRVSADEHREAPYQVNVTVSANGANATGSDTVTVTVPTTRVRDASQSVLTGSGSDTATVEVADAETFDQSLTIDVQAGNAGRSLKGLDYLVSYPYGCVEQTTSPMLSALYVDQYYRNASVSYDEATVDGSVLAGVDRLAPGGIDSENAQHGTGAWSMWGDSPSGDMFYTAYATFGTASVANDPIQGDRAAVARNVSRIDYNAAVGWLRGEQAADGSFRHQYYFDDREAVTGFILVGLRKADRVGLDRSASQDLSAIRGDAADYLLAEQRSDGSWGSAQSTSLAVWGLQTALESDADLNETRVRAAIDDGRSWLVENQQSDGAWEPYHQSYAWDNTGDRSESTAYALLALNATGVSNDNETVQSGVSYLAGVYEDDGSWGYTRATALAIRALTVTGGDDAVDKTVTVTIGGESMDNPITKDISVTASDPITQVELTDGELERLRSATNSSTRTVEVSTGSGDGRVYVEVLNDQVVNAAQYDG